LAEDGGAPKLRARGFGAGDILRRDPTKARINKDRPAANAAGDVKKGDVRMDLSKIPVGKNPPWDVNVIIEIPLNGEPVKYEVDKDSGAMFVDRFLHTAMYYPCNYGFVPHTLSGDGDPVDVCVIGRHAVVPGAVLRSRPVGVLIMEDEAGIDEKLLAVPVDKLHPFYSDVKNYTDLPQILVDKVAHFFQHYKDLEKGKWVKIVRWGDADEAAKLIAEGIERAAEYAKK
jgi:inorganic pyrophosphatase